MKKHLGLQFSLALSSASSMMYQVVVMNFLFFYFTENIYSASTVISVFLIGLGLGSYLTYYFDAREQIFAWLQLFTGVYGLVVLTNLQRIIPYVEGFGLLFTSGVLLLPATVCLGAVFPLAAKCAKKDVGVLYAIDLLGAVVGTLVAGFLLIPIFGNSFAAIIAAALNFVAFLIVSRKKILSITLVFVIAALFFFLQPAEQEITFSEQSLYGEVHIEEGTLYIDTRKQCTFTGDEEERAMVPLAMAHYERNLSIANVGLGCGATATELLHYTDQLDIIEINPVVVEANKHFTDLHKDDRANIIIADGLQYFKETEKNYDLIFVDIENPAIIHSANIYTQEAFEQMNNRLTQNGALVLWAYPCLSKEYDDILYNTLKEVFPYVYKPGEITFIGANKKLPYAEYAPEFNETNTLNGKTLSRVYFTQCSDWWGTEYDRNLVIK